MPDSSESWCSVGGKKAVVMVAKSVTSAGGVIQLVSVTLWMCTSLATGWPLASPPLALSALVPAASLTAGEQPASPATPAAMAAAAPMSPFQADGGGPALLVVSTLFFVLLIGEALVRLWQASRVTAAAGDGAATDRAAGEGPAGEMAELDGLGGVLPFAASRGRRAQPRTLGVQERCEALADEGGLTPRSGRFSATSAAATASPSSPARSSSPSPPCAPM